MPATTFAYDKEMEHLFEDLKEEFNATTKAEVLRKALALLDEVRKLREKNQQLAAIDQDGRVTARFILP